MNNLDKKIVKITQEFQDKISQISNEQDLENLRVEYLSRQGAIAQLMAELKEFSLEDKKNYGPVLNNLKQNLTQIFENKKQTLEKEKFKQLEAQKASFDVTAYKPFTKYGSLHPYTKTTEQIEDILISMGYEIIEGPEIDTDFYNFEALNIPKDHPARDMHDTFWLDIPNMVMRTHTSSVQAHTMIEKKLPIAVAIPGRCYRSEATDASHDYMFMQCEILFIDKNVSLSNLFATAKVFLQNLFGKSDLKIRIRPGYFPFVEPGVEIDMSCPFCNSIGCSVCKKTGWIEICGAGLIHPNVLKSCKINPQEYSGFAFGFGLTRLVMLKYGINDIRLLHSTKLEFLEQF